MPDSDHEMQLPYTQHSTLNKDMKWVREVGLGQSITEAEGRPPQRKGGSKSFPGWGNMAREGGGF